MTRLARQKILIVDDEPDILRSTQMLLRVLGYDAVTCDDARQVAAVAARERPDLILQDLKMPGIDLPGLVRTLRDDPATASIPVTFFSASPSLLQDARVHSAQGYMGKPFSEAELVTLLDRALPPARPQEASR